MLSYMQIAFFEVNDQEKEYFQNYLSANNELIFYKEELNTEYIESIKDIDCLATFINSSLKKEVLDSLPNLKFIATMSTGVDHIDIEECKKRNIIISNVPTYGEITVAEHTFALILAISRRIIESYTRVRDEKFSPEGLTGFDLFGKTLGVVGVGNIGKNVIRIAHGFGMNIIAYKRNYDPELEKQLNFRFVQLDELLSTSDIITLHIPLSGQTHHFINQDKFDKMKNGIVIINTSRGAIIDTKALLAAVQSGKVGGVGLDVCEDEPILREEKQLLSKEYTKEELLCVLENHMLRTFPNVIITPHNAFNSHEALDKIVRTTLENIQGFSSQNLVNVVK